MVSSKSINNEFFDSRPSGSPSKMKSNSHSSQKIQLSSISLEHYNKEVPKKSMSPPAAKKSKLPSSSEQFFQEEGITRQDEKNRHEIQNVV